MIWFQIRVREYWNRLSSIRSIGLLQPIVVRFKDDHYEIIAGNRRYAGCRAQFRAMLRGIEKLREIYPAAWERKSQLSVSDHA